MSLVKSKSLMQPFLPGSPGGRGGPGRCKGDGAAKRVDDDRWKAAFPDCKHNRWMNGQEQSIHKEE